MWEGLNTAVTVVPFPGSDSMEKLPPVCSAAILKSGTPSPTFRVVRVVKNGSVTRAACSAVIPDDLQRQGVLRAAFLHNNLRQGSPCRQGVLGDIHYIQRQLPHGFIRTLPKCP